MNPWQQSPKRCYYYYLRQVSIAIILLSVLNLPLIVSTNLLMSKLFFKISGASNPSFQTKTVSTDHIYYHLLYKVSCWDCNNFYIGKMKR